MTRTLFTILCCLTVLLAQPGLARACASATGTGFVFFFEEEAKYYVLGEEKCFHEEDKYEFNFQRFPAIAVAKLVSVTASNGSEVPPARDLKLEDHPFPWVYSFELQWTIKGQVEETILSEDPDGWGQSSCTKKLKRGETYLIFLPEKRENGMYPLREITNLGTPTVPLVRAGETGDLLTWLKKRVRNEPAEQKWFKCPAK